MSEATFIRVPIRKPDGRSLFVMLGLMGAFVLLPVQIFHLPLQMDLVDFWIIGVLSVFSLAFVAGQQRLRVNGYYLLAIWLILAASLVSSFNAVDRMASLVVVLKEVYLFAAFVAVALLLSRLSRQNFRLVMWVWLMAVALHGLLIAAEFLRPELFRWVSGVAGHSVGDETFRPSGLFFSPKAGNANKAAVFQMFGFVPLALAGLSRRDAVGYGLVLLVSILATGSMGTTIAFIAGLLVAIVMLAVLGKQWVVMTKMVVPTALAMFVIGGVSWYLISDNPGYQARFERIFLGRAEKSSEGRFKLWKRGVSALNDPQVLMFGVGAENFRNVDVQEKQLHNDLLAFTVERGILGAVGLLLLAGVAVVRAFYLVRIAEHRERMTSVIFLSAFAAVLVVSLTHQVFHAREIWLVLAVQEAMIFRIQRERMNSREINEAISNRLCRGGA